MFEWIRKKKNYFIGIDFGTSAIKIVELSFHNQKIHLENYGWADLGLVSGDESNILKNVPYDQKLKSCLRDLVRRIGPKSGNAFVSLPGFNGLIALVDFPGMNDEELEKAIQFEAHKYIPIPLEEVSLSWDVVKRSTPEKKFGIRAQKSEEKEKIQVVLAAAPLKEIIKYENIFRDSGIDIKIIEIETFSLARSIIGDDLGAYIIIDIGARATNIILVEKGIVRVNRNIDAGGNEITGTISDVMNISKTRAETLKKEKKDILNNREFPVVLPTLELIVNETKRILASYRERDKGVKIDGIILSGGSSKMPGIDEYFSRALNIKATISNPWKKVVVDKKLEPVIRSMGASFSVALGLAFRGVEEYQRK